jgi:hypothetical protein
MQDGEYGGYWWLPGGSIEDGVAGLLTVKAGRLPRVSLWGSLSDEDDVPFLAWQDEPVILGLLSDGQVVTALRSRGSAGVKQRDASMLSEHWTANAVLVGVHIDSEAEAVFHDVDIELNALSKLVPGGLSRTGVTSAAAEWRWDKPPTLSTTIGDLNIALEVVPHGGHVLDDAEELRFWAVPRFRVHAQDPMDLERIIEHVLYPLVDLTSLMVGEPASIERLQVHKLGAEPGGGRFADTAVELLISPSRRPSEPGTSSLSMALGFADEAVGFDRLVVGWMQLWSKPGIGPLLERFFLEDRRPSPFPEATFLGLAVFLEGFHKAAFSHSGMTYPQRLAELLDATDNVLEKIGADRGKVLLSIKDTRNTLAHGRRSHGDATVDEPLLRPFNRLVDLLIRALLLRTIGLEPDEVDAALRVAYAQRQSRSSPWAV